MRFQWHLLPFIQCALAGLPPGKKFWWTALGDSYASGVGSNNYLGGERCLRYDRAYPRALQWDTDIGGGNLALTVFQNCVCSGSTVDDMTKYQLLDDDTSGVPNFQFGDRPKFGEPWMATLQVGGDDIDFPGLLLNCMLESHVPGGPPSRSCEDQRTYSWGLIKDPKLVDDISGLIGKILDKARRNPIGDKFLMYVVGYGQFFNAKTDVCDDVTFARVANPKDDGKPHQRLTKDIRDEFNQMSIALNNVIKAAVDRNKDRGVKFVDMDSLLDNHRFCEEGVHEPDQNRVDTWFHHYPYKQDDSTFKTVSGQDYTKVVNDAINKVYGTDSLAVLGGKYPNTRAIDDAFYQAVDWQEVKRIAGPSQPPTLSGSKPQPAADDDLGAFWGYVIGDRAKLFHPVEILHNKIEWIIYDRYKADAKALGDFNKPAMSWGYNFNGFQDTVDKGKFAFFVLPGRYNGKYNKRSIVGDDDERGEKGVLSKWSAKFKRIVGPYIVPSPANRGNGGGGGGGGGGSSQVADHTNGKVDFWTQDLSGDGTGALHHGSFDLDCSAGKDEAAWQIYKASDVGLAQDFQIQSGHACSFRDQDLNLDNLHVQYAGQYYDIPTAEGKGQCKYHNNGVSCNTMFT